jgi:hypothetical protein
MNGDLHGFVEISKVDDEKRMVYGVAQSDSLDNQDEIVEWNATKEAVPEYEKWRNLREMHTEKAVGTVPDIEVRDGDRQLYIGAKVVDDDAWKKVKEKVYKGFSIGGKALNRIKEFDIKLGKSISKVKKYVLNEISLVDRPANPDCVFEIVKRSDDDIPSKNDPLSKDVDMMRKIVHSLDKKILTNNQIKKLGDNVFALIRKKGKEVERLYPVPSKAHAKALLKQLMKLDVTDRERHVIHEKIKKVLGNKHSLNNCEYCKGFAEILLNKRGGDQVMDRAKLEQAKALIDELLASPEEEEMVEEDVGGGEEGFEYEDEGYDFEGQKGDDNLGAETEDIVPAPEKDETEDIPELQGSRYPDKEGADAEGWTGDDGYSVGLEPDEDRTHLYDTEAERKEKQEMEGGECPYCGATLKALMSGQFRKNSAVCPGCGVEYAVGSHPKVSINKRGGRRVLRKRATQRSDETMNLIGNMAKAIKVINDKVDKIGSSPKPRKGRINKYAGASEEVEGEEGGLKKKDMPDSLKKDMEKAVSIVKAARAAGRQLTPEEDAFNQSVLERSINHKVGIEG